jgi:putative phosphoesterase
MRIGIVSDVHCNAPALRQALDRLADCDEIFCAGDLMLQYRYEPAVLDLLAERGARVISGNHDTSLGRPELMELPYSINVELAGVRVAMHHGTPWDRPEEGIYTYLLKADRERMARAAAVFTDVLILGHTHVPMALTIEGTTIVNPGSCGEPNRDGERAQTCASMELETREVTFHTL